MTELMLAGEGKSIGETYGVRGSIRVDVLENVGDGNVCVYDIKTGKS